MSPRDRSPVRTPSPRQPREKTTGTSWTLTIWLCWSWKQTAGSSSQRGSGPPSEPGFSQGFFSILSVSILTDGVLFLATVSSGLLSWGHLISSTIIDLIAQILFKLNWDGWCRHTIQQWKLNWKLSVKSCHLHYWHTIFEELICKKRIKCHIKKRADCHASFSIYSVTWYCPLSTASQVHIYCSSRQCPCCFWTEADKSNFSESAAVFSQVWRLLLTVKRAW